jgi:phosphate-selective porin OprO and OprP
VTASIKRQQMRYPGTLVVTACLLAASVGRPADADPPTDDDVRAQLRELRSEIAKLRAANADLGQRMQRLQADQDGTWLSDRRREEVKSLVRDVLSDANTRASLQADAITAGHDGQHFYLGSADGGFLMQISGAIQVRYIYNHRNEDTRFVDENLDGQNDLANIDENEAGFQVHRTHLAFDGHVTDPRLGYRVALQADRGNGSVGLLDAVVSYKVADHLTVEAGRRKLPFLREELLSGFHQLAVERSTVTEVFTLNRGEGVWFLCEPTDWAKVAVAISDGQNSGEIGGGPTGSNDFDRDRTDFAVTARADAKLAGQWRQDQDFAAWDGEPLGVFLGAAIHYEIGETGDSAAINDADYLAWTADGLVEFNRVSVMAAVMGGHPMGLRSVDEFGRSHKFSRDNYGVLVQAAVFVIPDKLQPFIRYEYIRLDNAWDQSVSLVTVGANYYLRRHNAKFTLDFIYAFDPLTEDLDAQLGTGFGANGVSSGLGLRPDNGEEDGQFAIRAQFQLLF